MFKIKGVHAPATKPQKLPVTYRSRGDLSWLCSQCCPPLHASLYCLFSLTELPTALQIHCRFRCF